MPNSPACASGATPSAKPPVDRRRNPSETCGGRCWPYVGVRGSRSLRPSLSGTRRRADRRARTETGACTWRRSAVGALGQSQPELVEDQTLQLGGPTGDRRVRREIIRTGALTPKPDLGWASDRLPFAGFAISQIAVRCQPRRGHAAIVRQGGRQRGASRPASKVPRLLVLQVLIPSQHAKESGRRH